MGRAVLELHSMTQDGTKSSLTSAQRKHLKALAHHLAPVVMYGQHGQSQGFIGAMEQALLDHELIKMKFIDGKEQKRDLAPEIASKTGAVLVGLVGNVALYYRPNPKKKNAIKLPA